MSYRQQWLKDLLTIQRDLNQQGHEIELVRSEELHAIRREWLFDPNEPDWADTLPAIYREVFGEDLDWATQDAGAFTKPDADLLKELESEYEVPAELVMKLIELEQNLDGLGKRRGFLNQIGQLLEQDWGSLESIKKKHQSPSMNFNYDDALENLTNEYEAL